jgi:hypothetical protein
MIIRFKDYVKKTGLIITVEDAPEYDTTLDFRIIDNDEFAMRSEFISQTETMPVASELLVAVTSMNILYNTVSYGKQFGEMVPGTKFGLT